MRTSNKMDQLLIVTGLRGGDSRVKFPEFAEKRKP